MRKAATVLIVLAVNILVLGMPVQSSRTVLDGVYTTDQAARGEKDYQDNCARCHEGNDPEGPTLMGRTFVDRWREDNLDELFDFMSSRMPADRADKLEEKTYLEILAYLLEANEYPAGSKELDAASLETTRLVGPDGPKPLPANSLVKIVGCLAQEGADFNLARASEPARSREGKETSPEELKKSAAKALGSHSYKLTNFTNISFDFKPDPLVGHKVQVKGVLLRSGNAERISLTRMDSVAATCEK